MSILLTAINSRYSHTNLAVRSICEYIKAHSTTETSVNVNFQEWTIAHYAQDILRGILSHKPSVVVFSVYIWNTRLVFDVIRELRKVSPNIVIGLGGPDVSYRAKDVFNILSEVDFVMHGEGEQTSLEIVESYYRIQKNDIIHKDEFLQSIKGIKGLYTKTNDGTIHFEGTRNPLSLDELAFPYTDFSQPDHKLYYYESSRGCPFSCSYCLSSIEKSVRFRSLDLVLRDLQLFMDARVRIVKFVDRTYNLREERYLAIWKYIVENHNGYTMFHFEISAEHLDEKALDFLQTVGKGIMQFEIGIQSTNAKTLQEIQRPVNLDILSKKIAQIPKTIHSHLDLIAGLPHESLTEFEISFNYTLALKPDMLQLGFLKVLSGTKMEVYAKENGYEWLSNPPHEVLQSPCMSYEDICFLHDIETVLDWYYNSHYFEKTIGYLLEKNNNAFTLFSAIVKHFYKQGIFEGQHKTGALFDFLYDYCATCEQDGLHIINELLRFDYFYMGKTSVYPACFELHYDKDAHHAALLEHTEMTSTRESYTNSSFEKFEINPFTLNKESTSILFLYGKRAEKKQETQSIIV